MTAPKHKRIRPLVYLRFTIEFIFLMIFNLILFILPWAITWRLGRGLGWLSYKLLTKRKTTVVRNIRRAYPDKSVSEIEDMVKGCYQHWGEGFISTLKLWMISRRKVESLVDAPGLEDFVMDHIARKDPILYFTGHFGSWEMAGRYVGGMGDGAASIYRIQKNPLVDGFLTWIREYHQLVLVNSWSGMPAFEDALKRTFGLAVVGDQYKGKKGVSIDFFGIPSSTPRGAAVLTYRVKPTLVVLICTQHRGRYKIRIEEIDYETPERMSEAWIQELTQRLTNRLESAIREYPEQYFWFHRRWRDLDRKERKANAAS